MKKLNILGLCGLALMSSLSFSSCEDTLEQHKRDTYDPSFLKTEDGMIGSLTALYAHLRNIYGQAYYYNACETGTDEYTYAQSADGNFKDADLSGVGNLNPSSCRADVVWGQSFSDINTASSVIEIAPSVGISDQIIAEAYFFRAFHYFLLVQNFGGVPLDLGGGELHSNLDTPSRESVRNTVPEVYEKCIFPDLEKALKELPNTSRLTGTVTKTTARLYLAKAYLTYAWWLENPNGVATYPECSRDASKAPQYFQKAYDMALEAINDSNSPNGLEEFYYLVNQGKNDRGKEWLLWADHTQDSEQYNGGSLTYGGGGAPDNFAGWMVTWNYCAWLTGKMVTNNGKDTTVIVPVQREACQPLGRPWTRMAASVEGLSKFTNTDLDSRWDGTFTAQYHINFQKKNNFTFVLGSKPDIHVGANETYLTFLPADIDVSDTTYNAEDNAGVQAFAKPGVNSWVIPVSEVSRSRYPGLWKLGPYRTDYDFDKAYGDPNAGSTRPFVIAKFSEFYLIAAEAAVKGATGSQSARDLVNVLRARAGRWNWSVNDDAAKVEDHSAELVALTPATIDIDYILDERLREYWGEGYRWFDLVRTQKWEERAGKYTICDEYSLNKKTITRTIEKYHYLRPIPQGQLDAMAGSPDDKKAYQNPGYN